jgi:hypothetical protein
MYMYVYDKYMNPVHKGLAEYHIHSDLDILPEQSVVEPGGGERSWGSPTREVRAKPKAHQNDTIPCPILGI